MDRSEVALITAGLQALIFAFWLGRLSEKLDQLRRDHDALGDYAHALNHEIISKISDKLDSLQTQILKLTPKEDWPRE